MNLIIIGNDVDELAKEVWIANTNYMILNMSPYLWGKEFKKFYKKHKDLIITTTSDQFTSRDVNSFVDLMNEYKFIPVFVTDDKGAIERCMHTAVEELIPDSVLYIGTKESENYPELVKILQEYLIKKD